MTIDRFEGELAVCETENGITNIHRSMLPDDAKEGDVIEYSPESGSIVIDREATEAARGENASLLRSLLSSND